MSTNFKREFVIELHKKGKNTRQILDEGKLLRLNKMLKELWIVIMKQIRLKQKTCWSTSLNREIKLD